jgi:hypothetical protein
LRRIVTRVLATTDDPAALPLRLALGIMILPHGMQKVLGVFGGYGIAGTLSAFSSQLGIPRLLGIARVLLDSAGTPEIGIPGRKSKAPLMACLPAARKGTFRNCARRCNLFRNGSACTG